MPDVLDGLQFHAFAGGMRLYDAWADAGNLNAWIVGDKEAGLLDEMHGHHAWAPAQHVEERVGGELQEC